AEIRIFDSLDKPTSVNFFETPLVEALLYLKGYHNLDVQFDAEALTAAKISEESPVTLELDQVRFGRLLDTMLAPLGLDWTVNGPQLVITTPSKAAAGIRARLEQLLRDELE